jgi:hypothetical protein
MHWLLVLALAGAPPPQLHDELVEMAYLTDRVLTGQGKPQRYGTQLKETRKAIEEARKAAGR